MRTVAHPAESQDAEPSTVLRAHISSNVEEGGIGTCGVSRSLPLGVWLAFLALALFLIGILAPSLIVNRFGIVGRLSLLDGIGVLWSAGHSLLAVLILFFTILFPPTKLALTVLAAVPLLPLAAPARRKLLGLVEALGRWSLLDVLVIAILIVTIKVHGFVSVDAAWGIYAFTLSIILSMLAAHFVKSGRPRLSLLIAKPAIAGSLASLRLARLRPASGLIAFGLMLLLIGTAWLGLQSHGTVEQILVTRNESFIQLPRLFGDPSYYLVVETLEGPQRLDTKRRTPIGNGLTWILRRPVPLSKIYEVEMVEDGLFTDKVLDRVSVSGRREKGQCFQFDLQGRRNLSRPIICVVLAFGAGLWILHWLRKSGIWKSPRACSALERLGG